MSKADECRQLFLDAQVQKKALEDFNLKLNRLYGLLKLAAMEGHSNIYVKTPNAQVNLLVHSLQVEQFTVTTDASVEGFTDQWVCINWCTGGTVAPDLIWEELTYTH